MSVSNVSKRHKLTDEQCAKRVELIDLARGNLSIPQFAKKAGIAHSILYKIKSGATREACSYDVLAAIAKNAAEGSGVTLEALLEANGYPPPNTMSLEEAQGLEKIKTVFMENIPGADFEIVREEIKDDLFGFFCDYKVSVNGITWLIDDESTMIRWGKYSCTDTVESEMEAYEKAIARCIFRAQSGNDGYRYSLLIREEECFNKIGKVIETLKLDSCVSVVFVKFREGRIIKVREKCCMDASGIKYGAMINVN